MIPRTTAMINSRKRIPGVENTSMLTDVTGSQCVLNLSSWALIVRIQTDMSNGRNDDRSSDDSMLFLPWTISRFVLEIKAKLLFRNFSTEFFSRNRLVQSHAVIPCANHRDRDMVKSNVEMDSRTEHDSSPVHELLKN